MSQQLPRLWPAMDGWTSCMSGGALIPTLNELANGSPFTLTPFAHTFTHRALLAYPLGHRKQGKRPDSLPGLQLGLKLDIFLMFKRQSPTPSKLLSCVFKAGVARFAYTCQRRRWFCMHYICINIFNLFHGGRGGWQSEPAQIQVDPA